MATRLGLLSSSFPQISSNQRFHSHGTGSSGVRKAVLPWLADCFGYASFHLNILHLPTMKLEEVRNLFLGTTLSFRDEGRWLLYDANVVSKRF
jgi:hypothetical protein